VSADRITVYRRITVGLIRKSSDQLDELAACTGMTSTDIVNRAIMLAAFIAEQTIAGKELLLRDVESGAIERIHLL
jgi:hypothetical protein